MGPEDKLYWMRVALAVVAAYITVYFDVMGKRGIMLGVLIYLLSYWIAKYGMHVRAEDVGGTGKFIFTGFGSYLLLFIVVWAIFYNAIL